MSIKCLRPKSRLVEPPTSSLCNKYHSSVQDDSSCRSTPNYKNHMEARQSTKIIYIIWRLVSCIHMHTIFVSFSDMKPPGHLAKNHQPLATENHQRLASTLPFVGICDLGVPNRRCVGCVGCVWVVVVVVVDEGWLFGCNISGVAMLYDYAIFR